MQVGYVYDPVYLEHDTGDHPENAERLRAVMARLEESGLKDRLVHIKPRAATLEEIGLVHSGEYIASIQAISKRGGGWLDGDTVTSSGSYKAAAYAVGGVIKAVDTVMTEGGSVYALVRPPGHHATTNQAMGFCLFNNVAITTRYALKKYNLSRIAIIDFDVHHGNGTQGIFYGDPQVLYISPHEYPLYPGTGDAEETGSGEGKGTTVNIPMPPGCGDIEYLRVFNEVVAPAVRKFKPELILVSAGYDPHWSDSLALMDVTVTGFARMAEIIKKVADEVCPGRLVFALEGGYPLKVLAASVKATFDVLLGEKNIDDPIGPPPPGSKIRGPKPPDISDVIETLRKVHGLA